MGPILHMVPFHNAINILFPLFAFLPKVMVHQNRPGYGYQVELLRNRRSRQLISKSQYRYFVTVLQPLLVVQINQFLLSGLHVALSGCLSEKFYWVRMI